MLLPFRDVNPSSRLPLVVFGLITLNVLVFLLELAAGKQAQNFIYAWGFIPFELFYHELPPYTGYSPIINIFTSMFMHGGFLHIIGNMLFLWIFGDNVEDFYGHIKFLIFYLTCGTAAALTQAVLDPSSTVPMVGASGAISGVLGAYLYLYPHARVRTLFFFFIFIEIIEIPASIYLIFWFMYQFFGLTSPVPTGVAFGAHVGGFIAGLLITRWTYRRRYIRGKVHIIL